MLSASCCTCGPQGLSPGHCPSRTGACSACPWLYPTKYALPEHAWANTWINPCVPTCASPVVGMLNPGLHRSCLNLWMASYEVHEREPRATRQWPTHLTHVSDCCCLIALRTSTLALPCPPVFLRCCVYTVGLVTPILFTEFGSSLTADVGHRLGESGIPGAWQSPETLQPPGVSLCVARRAGQDRTGGQSQLLVGKNHN